MGRVFDASCALLGLPGRLRWMIGVSSETGDEGDLGAVLGVVLGTSMDCTSMVSLRIEVEGKRGGENSFVHDAGDNES